jgi:transcriptional regulator with XRE-family HTH domain
MQKKILRKIGKAIRRRRKHLLITQEGMAMDADLDRAYCGRVERGEINISALNLIKIAKALNCNAGEFFKEEEKQHEI